jgi:hypothetical protein
MHRVSEVISRSFVASLGILVLASCASAATRSTGSTTTRTTAAHDRCLPPGAQRLAADRVARVYSLHGSVYGCIEATGRRRKLGSAGSSLLRAGRVGSVSLGGLMVAYGLERCGVDTCGSTVAVRDLASGSHIADLVAGTLALRPESFVSVAALVVRSSGAVGWIAEDGSILSHGGATYEVHRFERGGQGSLLDSGASIQPKSLRLAGSRMTWQHGSATRSATLS